MRLYHYILASMLLVSSQAYAQYDGAYHLKSLLKRDSIVEKNENYLLNKIDSLKRSDRTKNNRFKRTYTKAKNKKDSLRNKTPNPSARINSLKQSALKKSDSLQAKYNQDSILSGKLSVVKNKIDSASSVSIKLPGSALKEKADHKIDSIQLVVNAKKDKLLNRNLKIPELKIENSLSELGLPDMKTPGDQENLIPTLDTNLLMPNGVNTDIPNLNIPNVELGLSSLSNPLFNKLPDNKSTNKLPNVALPNISGVDTSTDKLGLLNLPKLDTDKLSKVKGLESVTDNMSEAGALKDQAGEYTDELKSIKENALEDATLIPEKLENSMLKLDEVKMLESEMNSMPTTESLQDPDEMKELAFNKSKEQVINHFAGNEAKIIAAIEKFAKVKSKIPNPEGVHDLLSNGNNSLKYKPFAERVLIGNTFQIQKPNNVWIDINPYCLYMLSRRFNVAIGWNYRFSLGKGLSEIRAERINGPRSTVEFKWKENISLKADIEVMNTKVFSKFTNSRELLYQGWVWSYFAGIKTTFKISKKLSMNTQLLYNLGDRDLKSPYQDRINLRFGIHIPIKEATPVTE